MSANKAPKESLIQYHLPAEVMNLDSATSENKRKEQMYDSRLAIDCNEIIKARTSQPNVPFNHLVSRFQELQTSYQY